MIAQLTGAVIRTEGNSVLLDVGGVGYQITVPVSVLTALPEPGIKATLLTHLVGRVQPDFEMTLYGFVTDRQLRTFRSLIGVQGVGAKVALAMLSTLEVDELARAISTNETKLLTKVPGVGPKLAQRLCLELGDSMAAMSFERRPERAAATSKTADENAAYEDVIEALVGLGYSRADSRRATDAVFSSAPNKTDTPVLIAAGLRFLTAGRK
jgi:Holliday junction DNA helicase RuvA